MENIFMFKELTVYKKAFSLAMEIFNETKKFPSEEKSDMTSQIRRSSRSVCASISEAYRKRNYPAYFVSKSSDADMENSETFTWIDFAYNCGYITQQVQEKWQQECNEVGKLLNHMIDNPSKYLRKNNN